MDPKVLIIHTLRWPNATRLALAFRKADCVVYALCRRRHPVHKLRAARKTYIYSPLAPDRSLYAALAAADPDLIILCDDVAVRQILQLYNRLPVSGTTPQRIRQVIERSLGDPASYRLVASRSNLTSVADRADVLIPPTNPVSSLDDIREWVGRVGFPAVLKSDHSWGGRGVSVVNSLREAEIAFRGTRGATDIARAIKRLIWDRDVDYLARKLRGERPVLSVQSFIQGKLANCAVACWKGELLASISVEVLAAQSATAHATVVRVVEDGPMLETARRVVRHLGISGFCGFDFVIEENSDRAYLIEINPRATQINHLALGAGRDHPAALRARVANEPVRESPAMIDRDTIALFPQEADRDPESSFQRTAYHDVPSEETGLVRAYRMGPV